MSDTYNARDWRTQVETAYISAEATMRGGDMYGAFDALNVALDKVGQGHSADRWIKDTHQRQNDTAESALLVHFKTVAEAASDRELREAAERLNATDILILSKEGGSGKWRPRWLNL